MNLKHCGSNCRNSIWIHFHRVFCFFPSNALAIMGKSRKEIHFPQQSVTNHEWLFFKLPLCISVRTDSSRCTSPPRKNPKLLRTYLAHMFSQTVGSNDYFDYICDMRYLDASENEECSVTWSIRGRHKIHSRSKQWMRCECCFHCNPHEKATSADLFAAMAWDIFLTWTIVEDICCVFGILLLLFANVCNMAPYVQFVIEQFSSLAVGYSMLFIFCWCIPAVTVSCYPFSLSLAANVAFFACLIMLAYVGMMQNAADMCGRSSPKEHPLLYFVLFLTPLRTI